MKFVIQKWQVILWTFDDPVCHGVGRGIYSVALVCSWLPIKRKGICILSINDWGNRWKSGNAVSEKNFGSWSPYNLYVIRLWRIDVNTVFINDKWFRNNVQTLVRLKRKLLGTFIRWDSDFFNLGFFDRRISGIKLSLHGIKLLLQGRNNYNRSHFVKVIQLFFWKLDHNKTPLVSTDNCTKISDIVMDIVTGIGLHVEKLCKLCDLAELYAASCEIPGIITEMISVHHTALGHSGLNRSLRMLC